LALSGIAKSLNSSSCGLILVLLTGFLSTFFTNRPFTEGVATPALFATVHAIKSWRVLYCQK
jgi:hypothetical protein